MTYTRDEDEEYNDIVSVEESMVFFLFQTEFCQKNQHQFLQNSGN
jgi:hypothetical protein